MPRAAHCRAGGTLLLLARNQDLPGSRAPDPVALCRFPTCVHAKKPNAPLRFKPKPGEIDSNTTSRSQAASPQPAPDPCEYLCGIKPLRFTTQVTLWKTLSAPLLPTLPCVSPGRGPALAPNVGLSFEVHSGVCARMFMPPRFEKQNRPLPNTH